MNPLDARETEETYEYPARPYTLPMRPQQTFRVLSTSGDTPTPTATSWTPHEWWCSGGAPGSEEERPCKGCPDYRLANAWDNEYLTAEDARVLRQDGI